jgi:hypothetical protein
MRMSYRHKNRVQQSDGEVNYTNGPFFSIKPLLFQFFKMELQNDRYSWNHYFLCFAFNLLFICLKDPAIICIAILIGAGKTE